MNANHSILSVIALSALVGCRSAAPISQTGDPIPIIVLSDIHNRTATKRYIMLRLDYGLIISNGDTNRAPSYYLFCRDQKKIIKTDNVDVFLAEIEKLPDGATIDMVSKCTVPFYTQYGVNIDQQYKTITSILERKRFNLVSSMKDDERHATFCYCESRITILDEYVTEHEAAGTR